MGKEYIGLLIYDTDFDVFARCVGEELEKSPPENVKVVRYTGKKNYPGWKSLSYDNEVPYQEYTMDFIIREGWDVYKQLKKEDSDYAKEHIDPWFKQQVKEYDVDYVISLHDTPADVRNKVDIDCGTFILNMKLRKLLKDYRKQAINSFHDKGKRIGELDQLQLTTPGYYHYIAMEFFYNHMEFLNGDSPIDDAIFSVKHLSDFLNTNYVRNR